MEPSIDPYRAPHVERSFLAAVVEHPPLYWELHLPARVFDGHREVYEAVSEAIEAEEDPPDLPGPWTPASDPEAAAERLRDLARRRRLVELLEHARSQIETDGSALAILEDLEERAAAIRGELQTDTGHRFHHSDDLVADTLDELRDVRERFKSTGSGLRGVRTGLDRLDDVLGGFRPGLSILSGGPGVGKTSLCLQIAADAAEAGTPALYVAFENSPTQLTVKGIGAAGGINSRELQRGQRPMQDVRAAASRWKQKTKRLAFLEGAGDLRIGQIRGKARRLMSRHDAQRCLIVIDYLQLYAKSTDDLEGLSVSERVEIMGDQLGNLGKRLRSPVLAILSQTQEGYGSGANATGLDTLNEAGDLEYTAEAVAFLTEATDRMATDPARAIDLTISKNRHGELGTINLMFRPDLGTLQPHGPRTRSATG